MHYDVAIIGAGFSGLAAGIRLAHFGRRVCIFEKHTVWGGLNSFYKKGGHHFDTGLHAVTNFVPPGHRGARLPLERVCRQLRIDLDQLALEPQTRSDIVFSGGAARLSFTNELAFLEAEIERLFPRELDGFQRLKSKCAIYPDLSRDAPHLSSRRMLSELFREPLLIEMLLAPVLFYGSAEENDIDFDQFIILFKSIFEEGFGRPRRGVRQILEPLVRRYAEAGGEMRRRAGIERLIVEGGRVRALVLEGGESATVDQVISSAGLVETMRLRSDAARHPEIARSEGQLSFVETIWVLDRAPKDLGHDTCVTFFCEGERLSWARPHAAVDLSSGVICCPSNYAHAVPIDEPVVRATHLADHRCWMTLAPEAYQAEKRAWNQRSLDIVTRYTGNFRMHVIYADSFTPRTVKHYTGKANGAIYGSPDKQKTGRTDLENLFLCGTDQGLAGIVGAMLSGINIANAHALSKPVPEVVQAERVEPRLIAPPAPTSPSGIEQRKARDAAVDRLRGLRDRYDLIVIGSGLAGLTAANRIAKNGYSVLLLEQHYNFGGMATWFKRQNGHIFDISLHGFPAGMIKTCRKYWTREIADSIVRLRSIRFDNPQFSLETTYDKTDFIRILRAHFGIAQETIDAFFETVRSMSFYDDQTTTTRELFERFFPGRSDVVRLLMEPIAYANGSTLDDPAITYGIVFSNFMSDGVFTFQGGTNVLIKAMKDELTKNGVDIRNYAQVEQILIETGEGGEKRASGVVVNGRRVRGSAVVSNANLKTTIQRLVGAEHWPQEFAEESARVRMNNSSSQVYLGIRKGETIPHVGELLFSSTAPTFDSEMLCALDCTSRTYSFYYPEIRPGTDRYTVVASINSNYQEWAALSEADYQLQKEKLARETIAGLERYVPGVASKIDHVEVSTPRTFKYFTQHEAGASFGTKFEGLKVSQSIPKHIAGLFHAGSVGIIMSGWLGAANYGVIVANEVDRYLYRLREARSDQERQKGHV